MARKSYETLLIERKRPHRTRGRFKVVRVPQAMLRPAGSSTEPFKPVTDLVRVAKAHEREILHFLGWYAAGILAIMGELLAFAPLGFLGRGASAPEQAVLAVSLLATLGSGIGGGLFASRRAGFRRLAYRYRTVSALRLWLKERYNLDVPQESFADSDVFLLAEEQVGSKRYFADDGGKSFAMVMGEEGLFVEEAPEQPAVPAKDYTPSGTVAALTPARGLTETGEPAEATSADLAALLEGDAQALHSRTATLLATFANRALSTEHQHVVNRVRADLNQLLVLNRELRGLGEVDAEAQAHLAEVLSNLNDELAEVLKAERVAIKKSIATQVDYVKRRRTALSGLALEPAPVQPSATERFDQHLLALAPGAELLAAMQVSASDKAE